MKATALRTAKAGGSSDHSLLSDSRDGAGLGSGSTDRSSTPATSSIVPYADAVGSLLLSGRDGGRGSYPSHPDRFGDIVPGSGGVLPGDTVSIDVTPDRPFFLRKGSWIANSHGVQVDSQWGGMANLFGGEGGFGFRASGQGEALVSIYGAVDIMDLEAGEQVTIDTGHVVAYDLTIQFRMRRAVEGRSIQSMKSGEVGSSTSSGRDGCFCRAATPRRSHTGWARWRRASNRARASAASEEVWAACSAAEAQSVQSGSTAAASSRPTSPSM